MKLLSVAPFYSAALALSGGMSAFAQTATSLQPPAAVQQLCYECHADGAKKGSFALDELIAGSLDATHRAQWVKVWNNVRREFMPPVDGDAMSLEQRREVTQWIEHTIFGVDPQHPDPGLVTIRRLNRSEYNFTINDLFGLNLNLKEKLPPDDTAFGFENIGDAQTLSPSLLARFLDLADFVVGQTILENGRPLPRLVADLKLAKADAQRDEQRAEITAAHDGRYKVDMDFTIGGWQDFGGDYRITLHVDDQVIVDKTLPLGGDTDYDFSQEISLTKGVHSVLFRAEPVKAELLANAPNAARISTAAAEIPKPTVDALNQVIDAVPAVAAGALPRRPATQPVGLNMKKLNVVLTGPIDAGILADYPESHRRIFFKDVTPADAASREAYARDILRPLASRAFRRPIDQPTLDRLVKIALRQDNFEAGVGQAIAALLSSPRFLFREEPQPEPDNPRSSHPVDDFALASRLSYLFWLSVPDDELNALAAKGQLRTQLRPQIARLLADPKAKRFFEDFTGQWLRTRNILTASITPDRTSKLVDPLRAAMKQETDLFFESIAREDRDLLELLTASYSYLNEPLAAFYGVAGVTGKELHRVELPADSHRGGLLTQASFLIATSNPNRTSPVKRGVFVLENLLATPPPPPPPNIPNLDDAKKEGGVAMSLREQLAAHRENKSCAACHAHFDPIGLALENYNNVGQWRDKDGTFPIDASGQMITGETFSDYAGLRALLVQRKDKFYRGITEHLMTYALGRGLEPYDAVTVERITDELMRNGGKFSTLINLLIESPAFEARRGDEPASTAGRTVSLN